MEYLYLGQDNNTFWFWKKGDDQVGVKIIDEHNVDFLDADGERLAILPSSASKLILRALKEYENLQKVPATVSGSEI